MAQKSNNTPQSSRKRGFLVLWTSVIVLTLLIFALPTVILVVCGMLPTFVAFVIDRQPERYATFCVASMNVCGVFPHLLDLWMGDHTMSSAVHILTDVFALFIIFGAAAFGWVMFTSIPPVISSFMGVIAQHRVNALRGDQKKLVEEWGEAVGNKVEKSAPKTAGQPTDKDGKQSANDATQLSTPNEPADSQKAVNPHEEIPDDSTPPANAPTNGETPNGQALQTAQAAT